jgi:hypothetical protein
MEPVWCPAGFHLYRRIPVAVQGTLAANTAVKGVATEGCAEQQPASDASGAEEAATSAPDANGNGQPTTGDTVSPASNTPAEALTADEPQSTIGQEHQSGTSPTNSPSTHREGEFYVLGLEEGTCEGSVCKRCKV